VPLVTYPISAVETLIKSVWQTEKSSLITVRASTATSGFTKVKANQLTEIELFLYMAL
jgi:hypothetical protein